MWRECFLRSVFWLTSNEPLSHSGSGIEPPATMVHLSSPQAADIQTRFRALQMETE